MVRAVYKHIFYFLKIVLFSFYFNKPGGVKFLIKKIRFRVIYRNKVSY